MSDPVVELEPIGTAELEMASALVIGAGPAGTRVIVELVSGRFEGSLSGVLRGHSGADWVTVGPDGTGLLDVRLVVETDGGALVYLQSIGRTNLAPGAPPAPSVLATTFETASPDHAWLNGTLALTRADIDGRQLRYTIYAVKAV